LLCRPFEFPFQKRKGARCLAMRDMHVHDVMGAADAVVLFAGPPLDRL
jgi:hypothetical protein